MRINHFGHACVLVETDSARILIDPGTLSAGFETLTGLDAILVTHGHFDHLDTERLPALVAANPKVALVVDEGSAEAVRGLGLDADVVRPGDHREFGPTALNVVGGTHAPIHPDFPPMGNNGYVLDHGAFYHPGDSLFVPEQAIDVLGLPVSGPWLKLSESADFLRAVRPRVGVAIHEAVIADRVMPMITNIVDGLKPDATTFSLLPHGEVTTL